RLHDPRRRGARSRKRVGRHPRPAGDTDRPWRALGRGSRPGRGTGAPPYCPGGLSGQQRGARTLSRPVGPSVAPADRCRRARHPRLRRSPVLPYHARPGVRSGGLGRARAAAHHAHGHRGLVRRPGDQGEAFEGGAVMIARKAVALGAIVVALSAGAVRAEEIIANDLLLATLWTQRSVEFKGNALTVYALGKIRLDQALADKSWTAAPVEQKGDYQNLPPAVVLDLDETVLDNSAYQVWNIKAGQSFSLKTWNEFCAAQISRAIPGSVEFTKYADSKGVKVFYVSNRDVVTEKDTRENMQKLGYPMGGNVETFLSQNEQKDWGSKKGTRRAFIAKDYRILLEFGDNFGDFDDRYSSSEADRLKFFDENRERWGREWLVIANPTYGSFEAAPFGFDYKKSDADKRKARWDVLEGWAGPKQ